MAAKVIKDITVPWYLDKIKKINSIYPNNLISIACDTETDNGIPSTVQLHSVKGNSTFAVSVNEDNVTKNFISRLLEVCSFDVSKLNRSPNYVLFHNLEFDMPVIFFPYKERFKEKHFWIVDKKAGFAADVFAIKPWFCNLSVITEDMGSCIKYHDEFTGDQELKGFKKFATFKIADSCGFLKGASEKGNSLRNLANELSLNHLKADTPTNIGNVEFLELEFLRYAMNDAIVQYDLSEFILKMHKEFEVPTAVSIAQLAQYVFKKKFMQENEYINLPPRNILKASELSYHGGKNGFYINEPKIFDNVYDIDVNSMYPFALMSLPGFLKGHYEKTNDYTEDYQGIFCIKGHINDCKYPGISDHEFNYFNDTDINNVWVTSYEVKSALRNGDLNLTSLYGYVWIPDEEANNPIRNYVDYFYKLKQNTPQTDSKYFMYKLLLNALYGKFVQNVRYDTPQEFEAESDITGKLKFKAIKPKFKAGGLYNPFIGTLITGFARAFLHNLEHDYMAFDSATDSVKTSLNPGLNITKTLGAVSIKNYGKSILLRNKLYLHFGQPETAWEGKVKYALHGFQAKVPELIRILYTKNQRYKCRRMIKIRESLLHKNLNLIPMTFMDLKPRKLDIDLSNLIIESNPVPDIYLQKFELEQFMHN